MSKVVVCTYYYFIAFGGILPRMRNPEEASQYFARMEREVLILEIYSQDTGKNLDLPD